MHSYQKKEQNGSLENPQASINPTPIDGNIKKMNERWFYSSLMLFFYSVSINLDPLIVGDEQLLIVYCCWCCFVGKGDEQANVKPANND